jgi:predicted molibdopterin-dependent oxidoreductase YjgC
MKLTIDNREIEVTEGITILDAAEKHDIYIPHLCSHPELTPYGGCRLCIVEVEGMRGYPTACTAKVQEGMKVHTRTENVQEMRREIIQLILSEHPSGCLICDEAETCADTMFSIRKVGVTTGCRWCPKDGDCELQRVVQYLEIDDIKFPVYYQGLDVENYDPFFDRDYNLCIYCARCVRICEEQRKSFVLALNERGKNATVGPAFHNSHIEAECEFCGACVSVCPTGALSEKNRKWARVPSSYHDSICPLCSMNCEIQIPIKNGKIIGTLPPGDPHQSGGELCVKGRFCLGELVNHPDRVLEPAFRFPEGSGIVSWEDAVEKASEHLKAVKGKRVAFYLSPNLTLEEIAAVNQFSSKVMHTDNITSSVLNENLVSFLSLAEESIPLEEVEESGAIISVFLKGNYNYAPLTLAVKRAADSGVPLCQVKWTRDTASRFADLSISPPPGKEKHFFRSILNAIEKGKGGSREIKELITMIEDAPSTTFILGPEIADLTEGKEILQSIEKIVDLTAAKIFAPNPYGNLTGMLSLIENKLSEEVNRMVEEEKIDLLYIIGDAPFDKRPPVDFIIHQSSFPPPEKLSADLVLPTATWGEISGTYAPAYPHEKTKKIKAAVKPPGMALENREIFTRIAKTMGIKELTFTPKAISNQIPKNLSIKLPGSKGKLFQKAKVSTPDTYFPYLLIQERTPHGIHNVSLSQVTAGMAEIVPGDTIVMNPVDASKVGLSSGDSVLVESADHSKTYPLKLQSIISPGFVFLLTHARTPIFNANPCPVHLRRKDV